jgi:hypothetical protein
MSKTEHATPEAPYRSVKGLEAKMKKTKLWKVGT